MVWLLVLIWPLLRLTREETGRKERPARDRRLPRLIARLAGLWIGWLLINGLAGLLRVSRLLISILPRDRKSVV